MSSKFVRKLLLLLPLLLLMASCSEESPTGPDELLITEGDERPNSQLEILSPDPRGPSTDIVVFAGHSGRLTINIRGITGYKIKTVFDGDVDAGTVSVNWDGTNDDGELVLDGFYLTEAICGESKAYKVQLYCLTPDCGGMLDD